MAVRAHLLVVDVLIVLIVRVNYWLWVYCTGCQSAVLVVRVYCVGCYSTFNILWFSEYIIYIADCESDAACYSTVLVVKALVLVV